MPLFPLPLTLRRPHADFTANTASDKARYVARKTGINVETVQAELDILTHKGRDLTRVPDKDLADMFGTILAARRPA